MNDVKIVVEECDEENIEKILWILKKSHKITVTISGENENRQNNGNEERINKMLAGVGIPSHLKGYSYLKTAIELCMEDRGELNCITKGLYPKIAKIHSVDSNKVEHAIRNAIQCTWKKDNQKMRDELFGHSVLYGEKPTNSAFIATVTDYLQIFCADKETVI